MFIERVIFLSKSQKVSKRLAHGLFHLLTNGVYWGHNPLILTISNFQRGHPSMLVFLEDSIYSLKVLQPWRFSEADPRWCASTFDHLDLRMSRWKRSYSNHPFSGAKKGSCREGLKCRSSLDVSRWKLGSKVNWSVGFWPQYIPFIIRSELDLNITSGASPIDPFTIDPNFRDPGHPSTMLT